MAMHDSGPNLSQVDPPAPERGRQPVPWGSRDIAWAILTVIVAVPVGVGIGAILAIGLDASDSVLTLALSAFFEAVLLGVALRFSIVKYGSPWAALGFNRSWKMRNLGLVVGGIFLSLAGAAVYAVGLRALGFGDELPSPPNFVEEGSVTFALGAVLAVGVAPLAEETFFRGFVFGGLRGRLGLRGAAPLSAGLFALAHLDPITYIPIFLTGLILVWAYIKTGSLWTSIQLHMAYNAIVLVIARQS